MRRAIQDSQESLMVLAKRYNINPKTITKWRKQTSLEDLPASSKQACSTVLSIEEQAIIAAY